MVACDAGKRDCLPGVGARIESALTVDSESCARISLFVYFECKVFFLDMLYLYRIRLHLVRGIAIRKTGAAMSYLG